MTEEFTAGDFEQVEVAAVVNVISNGAIGVADAVRVFEDGHGGRIKGGKTSNNQHPTSNIQFGSKNGNDEYHEEVC